jgi:hypothetical protein
MLAHQGADVWALLPKIVVAAATRGSQAAAALIYNAPPNPLTDVWGPTLVSNPALGTTWDLAGPGMPHLQPPSVDVGNGTNRAISLRVRAGIGSILHLHADLVHIAAPHSIGTFRGPDGMDRQIGDTFYCGRSAGCTCPDGTPAPFEKIGSGTGYLGVANFRQIAYVQVAGESLDDYCNGKRPSLGSGIRLGQGGDMGGIVIIAHFTSGACIVGKNGFTATATDRGYDLTVRIRHFVDFNKRYELPYGRSDPGFTVDGVGGPFSNRYRPPSINPVGGAVQFADGGKTMSLGFLNTFNSDVSQVRIIFGLMTCKYPKKR